MGVNWLLKKIKKNSAPHRKEWKEEKKRKKGKKKVTIDQPLEPRFGSFFVCSFSPIHIKFSFVGVSGVTCSALVSIPSITSPPTPPRPQATSSAFLPKARRGLHGGDRPWACGVLFFIVLTEIDSAPMIWYIGVGGPRVTFSGLKIESDDESLFTLELVGWYFSFYFIYYTYRRFWRWI